MKKPRHALQPIKTALKHWPRTADLFCSQGRCLMASIRLAHHALHRNWMTPNANHTADRRRVGSVTHASNNEAFVTKGSTTSVDHIPMLTVGLLRTEPTFTCCALRAPHHLNEILANICLHIASGTICHHPGIGRDLNI